MAHVAIVGAGVIGCASAWALTRAGHRVTLIEKAGVCSGASARNGAQLSYAYGDALASPGLLAQMPAILMGRDPAFRVWLSPDPAFLLWGLRFLSNATPARFRANTTALLQMAARTQALLPQVVDQFGLRFDYAKAGKMILYPDAASLASARATSQMKLALGIAQTVLTRGEATGIEPALAHYRDPIEGVVCEGGLDLMPGAEVSGLRVRNNRVTGLEFRTRPPLLADAVVLATGHGRLSKASPGGIWPVQGYSVTVSVGPEAMRTSITDVKRKLVFARLGDQVRIAGIADIGPRRFTFRPDRFTALMDGANAAFAKGFDLSGDVEPWSEARPCTPSSQPIIGPGKVKGLFFNLGHGTLGWTICLGAAEVLASHMLGALM